MLDDMLSGFSSAQLLLAPADSNPQTTVPATALVGAVRIGESKYIYPLAALNFLIVLLLIEEAVRFGGWKELHKFNVCCIFPPVASIISSNDECHLHRIFPNPLQGLFVLLIMLHA